MSQEIEAATVLAPSPSDVDVQDPNKLSKISYTREFLLSLAKVDGTVKLPREVQLSIPCVFHDASGLLSPPFCVPDSKCHKSVPQVSSLKVPDNRLLHRSNEPYRPPCRYKALLPSTRDNNDLLNSDRSGSSECTNLEKAERERWRKDTFEEKSYADTVRVAKEDKWHSNKNTDSKDSSEEFLLSPATQNSNTLQFTSNVINKQLDASCEPSLIHGAVRGDAVQPSILPETTKNCSAQCQQVQDLTTNETGNPWEKSVNHIDTSWCVLSMLDNGMHLMESEEYSNFDVGHPEGTTHDMEYLKKSIPPSFLSQEKCGNLKENHCEVVYEPAIMGLQLSNTSVCFHDSPGRIEISDLSEAHVSPPPVEEDKQFISMVKCESATVHCEGILSLQGFKQAISVSMKPNPSSPGFQIQQELELNSSSSSLDGKSNSSSELCLPDEDSLITFDESFLMPDVENSAVDDNSASNHERNPIKADVFSPPSSPRDMVEKLVESILNDESSPAPYLDDPIVQHGFGLEGFCHSMHAWQSSTPFCSNQLNPGRDQQDHNSSQRNSIDSAIYSLFSHSYPYNTISQSCPLSHDELRRFDHEVSQSSFQQMMSPGKLHLCSLCVSQSGVPPHLPAVQMTSCTQKLNSLQGCSTLGYQEPKYRGFIRPNPDFHGDSDINQAVADSLVDMELRSRHWHPYVGGF